GDARDPNRSFEKRHPRQAVSPGGSCSARRANQRTAMDVGGWLRKLGLEQYEPAFRENKIDSKILPRLTAEDLKDLGVALVGDRRRLLEAIASLRDEAAPSDEGIARLDAPVRGDGRGSLECNAERRHLTVMFCDLVGSTALSAQLDPE